MPRASLRAACFLLLASFVTLPGQAQSTPADPGLPPQAQMVNGVLVPVPLEIFRTLDNFRDSNWKAVLHPGLASLPPGEDSATTALSLGLVIGEGFLAAEAEDTDEIQNLGHTALKLARALGVEKSVLRRANSIIDHADRKEWKAVRIEWSAANADLKNAMIEIHSAPLSQMVSLGGWLRGLEALSALVSQHYSPADARLLYQPALLDYFAAQLPVNKAKLRSDPTIAKLQQGIAQLQPLIGSAHPPALTAQEVRQIRQISTGLVQSLTGGSR